jgi:DNA-directed RNA polymerase subunit RPC12/RpoP
MDLLTNAIESIRLGVDDYLSDTHPRLLSAVRNIHAGILLLYKEALRRLSPAGSNDVLLMAKVVPSQDADGKIHFAGVGKKTVDTQQIRERFDGLGITTDWRRFERIADARNDVEHRYPQLDQKALRGLIADSFLIVRNFLASELKHDPREELGEETWQAMLEVAEVYQKEKDECASLLAKVKWISATLEEGLTELTCSACGSDLLKPVDPTSGEIVLQCSSCGHHEAPESYVPKAIASALSGASYEAAKDGGETPYVRCPECGEETYVIEERCCALCEHEAEHTCARCGCEIPAEELDSEPYCGYCNHMMNKDD